MADISLRDLKGVRKEILYSALNGAQNLQENVNWNTIIDLDNIINTAEIVNQQLSLTEKVENQDEIVLDSEVMKSSSIVIKECSISLTKNMNNYNSNEYADLIIEYVRRAADFPGDNEATPWKNLESEITCLFSKVPFWSNLDGALKPLPKVAKVANLLKTINGKITQSQQKKLPPSQIKKPEKIERVEKETNAEEATVTVQKIRKIISNYFKETQSSLDYFQLVLDPTDFGKTVENILHVAFLVRDGYIKLFPGENGYLNVCPCSKEMIKQAKSYEKKSCIQNIFSLTFQQWQALKTFYNIEQPMIRF